MRGSKGGGGGWVSRILLGLFHKEYIFIVGFLSSSPFNWHPYCLVTRNAWNAPE